MDSINWDTTSWGAKVATVDFGVKDSRGRAVGAALMVSPRDGKALVLIASARDGKKFGAQGGFLKAATMDEGLALAVQKAALARTRVLKDAAKMGGVYLTASERKTSKVKRVEAKSLPAPLARLQARHERLEAERNANDGASMGLLF